MRTGRRVARLPTSAARGRRCIVTSCRRTRSRAPHYPVKVGVRQPLIEHTYGVPRSGSVPHVDLVKVPARRTFLIVMSDPHSVDFTCIVN